VETTLDLPDQRLCPFGHASRRRDLADRREDAGERAAFDDDERDAKQGEAPIEPVGHFVDDDQIRTEPCDQFSIRLEKRADLRQRDRRRRKPAERRDADDTVAEAEGEQRLGDAG
jgi:hypothetical protein